MKALIIIPAYNEELNIQKVVNNIRNNYPQYDYIVINDGSTDHTREICDREQYSYIDLPINLGIGGAVQAGYRYAYDKDYDIAIQIDGDGQHNIAYADEMVSLIAQNKADVVIGSRFIEKQGFQSSGSRRTGIKILSGFIKLCTGIKIQDVTSGFRAVNKKFINIYCQDYPNDYPEPEAIVTAVMYQGRIKEIPVVMNERQGGESSIKFWDSVYYMIKVTLAIFIRRIGYGIRK